MKTINLVGHDMVEQYQDRHKSISLKGRIRSFQYAIRGIGLMIQSQHNAWLHALATVMVVFTGCLCNIHMSDWCWLVLALMAVWTAEAMNTALEFLADVASPEFHPLVEKAKDVAAGAVLLSAIGSVIIGVLVFMPYLFEALGH